MTIVI